MSICGWYNSGSEHMWTMDNVLLGACAEHEGNCFGFMYIHFGHWTCPVSLLVQRFYTGLMEGQRSRANQTEVKMGLCVGRVQGFAIWLSVSKCKMEKPQISKINSVVKLANCSIVGLAYCHLHLQLWMDVPE